MDNDDLSSLYLYKLFYLVCQNGSFSKTAKYLGLTQPSVSYNIKKLEESLGVILFERGNKMTMTLEAKELLPYVEAALNNLTNGERRISDLIDLKEGKITIGIPSHVGVFLLTDILKKFNQSYPDINIEVICKPTKDLFKLLNVNRLDILIDCSPLEENTGDFHIKKIAREKCALACNIKNKELLARTIGFKELLNYPLIVPLKSSSSTKSLSDIFKKNNIPFEPKFEITTSDMIAEMLDQDMGIGFLFEKTIQKYPNLKKIDIDFILPEFDIFLLYRKTLLPAAAQKFIEFIGKVSL